MKNDKSIVEALDELKAMAGNDAVVKLLTELLEVQKACLVELKRLKK